MERRVDGEVDGTVVMSTSRVEDNWAAHYAHQDQADMSQVVQIIVPEMSCLHRDGHQDDLSTALHEVTMTNGGLGESDGGAMMDGRLVSVVGAPTSGMVEQHVESSSLVKDSLAALAAAAEMDQIRERNSYMMQRNNLKNNFKFAHFLDPNDPNAPFYNQIYQFLIGNISPDQITAAELKTVKKRATHYMINEKGSLSYGSNQPKEVVTSPLEQRIIMDSVHICKKTDVHLGVRKMYNQIFTKYYWRSMYIDIGNFVRGCTCSDEFEGEEPWDESVMFLAYDNQNVWKKVEVQLCGPYKKTSADHEYVVCVVDPFSRWMHAKALQRNDLEEQCANFILDTFSTYGFAYCEVFGLSAESFYTMEIKYRCLFATVSDILKKFVPLKSEGAQEIFTLIAGQQMECEWAVSHFDELCNSNPFNWDHELRKSVFEFVNSKSYDFELSPFSKMFCRKLTGTLNEIQSGDGQMETSSELNGNRRRLRSSTLQCRHCHETFTSKISFRIHQRKHTEEAKRRGVMDGEIRKGGVSKMHARSHAEKIHLMLNRQKSFPLSARSVKRAEKTGSTTLYSGNWLDAAQSLPIASSGVKSEQTESTVNAVRELLNATKEERRKRGKYYKYSQELRDDIAQYALDHNIYAATVHWSQRLGNQVSESSVRNFIKNYKCFSKEEKEEIGKYAFHTGIEKAMDHFGKKMNLQIRRSMVIKFKKAYIKLEYENNPTSAFSNQNKNTGMTRQKHSFSAQIKNEIGEYASQHGIMATMEHFSMKLQFTVKESTVRKFKRQFLERSNASNEQNNINDINNQANVAQEPQIVTQSMESQNSSLSVLQSNSNMNGGSNFIYQNPYSSINMSAAHSQNVIPMNNLALHQGSIINQTSLPYQQNQNGQALIMNQIPSIAPAGSFQQGYVGSFAHAQNLQLPASISQSSSASPMTTNSTLQLTMGGSHLNSLNSASANIHSVPHPHNIHHQIVTSPFNHHVSFECPLNSMPNVSICNEPLSLMKESQPSDALSQNHVNNPNQNCMQENTLTHATSIHALPGSVVHINNQNMSHLDPQTAHNQQQINLTSQTIANIQSRASSTLDTQQSSSGESDSENIQCILESEEDEEYYFDDAPKRRSKKGKYTPYTCGKRGNYVAYSPELRAEIAKHASDNGNLNAIKHFREKLGIEIPESTIRGLKDKYRVKKMRGAKEVKSLGFAQRGRPMRLGKYDAVVQDCIKELVRGGEKISSYLVIATARLVLLQYEPSLLQENGGPIKLNQTWAKSFLKRIGMIHTS